MRPDTPDRVHVRSRRSGSTGTVVANAVEVVRDTTGTTNTATSTYSYGYDAASNLTSRTHDGAQSTYTPSNLNQLSKETDPTSPTDPTQKVTSFTYTPTGQTATQVKPNGNNVTDTYYANNQLQNQTENTSGGTLVSSHAYTYDPNGNKHQDTQQLMSADPTSPNLSHTLTYAYDPMDRIATVATDSTTNTTESYTHDPNGNVISQSLYNPSTNSMDTTPTPTASNGPPIRESATPGHRPSSSPTSDVSASQHDQLTVSGIGSR